MIDPRKKRYIYLMLAGFGAISMSILLFFFLDRMQNVGAFLSSLSAILAPFIYGAVLAYLLRPMCNTMDAFFRMHLPRKLRKMSNSMAVFLSLVIGILVVYALIIMIAPQLYVSITTLWNAIPGKTQEFLTWANSTFGEDEQLIQFLTARYESFYQDIDKWIQETIIPQFSNIVFGVGTSVYRLLTFLYNLLIGLIVAVYLLGERKRFSRQGVLIVRSLLSDKWADMLLSEVEFVDKMFNGFIDGKIVDSGIIGILCYVGCVLLGIPNALLVSVIVGVTNIIPFFGPVIGAVPSTLFILIESPIKAVYFVIFVLVLQQLDGNVIGPKILGNRTGLSGFWVLFAIILFGGLWGIVGMVVCVPVFAVIYDLIRKLVIRGLKKKSHMEVWEQYRADFPEEPMT